MILGPLGFLGKLPLFGGKGKPPKKGAGGGVKPIYLYLLLGGAAFSLWQNWLSPKMEEVSSLKQSLELLMDNNLLSLQQKHAFLQKEVKFLEEEIQKEVGRGFSGPEVLAIIYRASLKAQLETITYEGVEERRGEGGPLSQTVFNLSGMGSYPEVVQFFQLLGEEGLRIGSLSLNPSREGETPAVSFRVQVVLYSFTPLNPR